MILHPPSVLNMGPAGSGKTTALVSLLASGLSLRLLATEPTAPARVLDEAAKRGIDSSKFDWCLVSPSPPKWDALKESARIISLMSLKDIANLQQGIAKPDATQWINLLNAISNFRSAKTGKDLGDATEWGPDCAFALDGLTGISFMSRALTVGLKPNPSPGEWGVMQNNILDLIRKLATDCKCFFSLISHVERETNDLTGTSSITVSTLGAKLAPKIPPWFTTVVLSKKAGENFYWSTLETGVDTKNGDLPLSNELPPSYESLVKAYRQRKSAAEGSLSAAQGATSSPTPAPAAAFTPAG